LSGGEAVGGTGVTDVGVRHLKEDPGIAVRPEAGDLAFGGDDRSHDGVRTGRRTGRWGPARDGEGAGGPGTSGNIGT
jgi:hypothetical protein